jgi:predicted ATPase
VAKVLDFGLAREVQTPPAGATARTVPAALTGAGIVFGTAAYMSPEQARGEPTDHRSDQFSFGAILYELATGVRPFARGSLVETASAVITDEPGPIDRLLPQLPPPLKWAIERCLAKRAADRYAATRDLYGDLVAVRDHLSYRGGHVHTLTVRQLPTAGTPLVGREHEVAAIFDLLTRDEVRWVTLTGPGGVGKTRVALKAAADLSAHYNGAVCFVPLATVTDFRLVASAIAQALDLRAEAGESPLDALQRHLRISRAPLLLVVDNFEQVADAAPIIAELLDFAPALRVLTTSRSVLHIYAEHEFPIPPLAVPDRRHGPWDAVARSPAVALFTQRASAARPDFRLTPENAGVVAEICTRLDGLPMAIELAAARIKLLPPAALLSRLEGRLLSLAGGARDLPARHQTLRNAIDWSYDLLTPAEQRLFRRLAVFVHGWTLESVEAVCDAREDLGLDILDGLGSLVDKSLALRVEPVDSGNEEPRFMMLETIREYALERLEAADEADITRRAHAAYCVILAEEGSRFSDPEAEVRWLAQCDAEHANYRAALRYLTDAQAVEWGFRLATALLPFWQARGFIFEGRDRLTELVELPVGRADTELRARALFSLGTFSHKAGDFSSAIAVYTGEALRIYRAIGDRRGVAMCLNGAGVVHRSMGSLAEARQAFEEALAIWTALGDDPARALVLSNLASVTAAEGDLAAARAAYQQCRAISERAGHVVGATWIVLQEGDAARKAGDVDAASRLYHHGWRTFLELGERWGVASALEGLGHLARDSGDPAAARRWYEQALRELDRLRDRRGVARLIEALANTAADQPDAARALTLAGSAAALRDAMGIVLARAERDQLEQRLDRLRREPAASDAAAAWMRGWSMGLDDAVQYALAGTADERT